MSATALAIEDTGERLSPQWTVRLVGAAIGRDGRYLITRRRSTGVLPDLWEFPGGRVGTGDGDHDVLRDILADHLGLHEVEIGPAIAQRTRAYDRYSVEVILYKATIVRPDEPKPMAVAECRWVAPEELARYPFPQSDQATMDLLLGFRR